MAELADDDDCYVTFDEFGTTSASSSSPRYWPSVVLDELAVRQQPPVHDHPLTTVRVSSGSSHTSLELPATPVTYSGSPSESRSSSSVEIEVSHIISRLKVTKLLTFEHKILRLTPDFYSIGTFIYYTAPIQVLLFGDTVAL